MTKMPTAFVPLEGDQPAETKIHLSDGTFVKSYKVRFANTGLPQHSHGYSHTMYIATGSVQVWQNGVDRGIVTAPDGILIPAHTKHFFKTLEDNTTVLCIHSVLEGDEPEIEDHHVVTMQGATQPRPARVSMEGFTFQEESVDAWYADATTLFRLHMAATGQGIDDWQHKNIALGRQMDTAGAIQIITARCNGRMFGYLVSVIGPSLDNPTAIVAQQMPIFADPGCPGLGMKLALASIAALKAKGVTEVLGRAGLRGSGPRLGTMYRRLGFEDAGHLFRLEF